MAIISAPSPYRSNAFAGMALALLAFALLTSIDTIFKLLATDHPIYQLVFTNSCFALLPIFLWAALTGGVKPRLRTGRLAKHMLRGCISVTSGYMAIYAYSRLPLTDYYAIVFAGPLLVTTMSVLWLREKIELGRWLAILVGFSGVLIVVNPFHHNGDVQGFFFDDKMLIGRLEAFGSVACYALSVVIIRYMRSGETNITFSLYGYVTSVIVSGILWLFHYTNTQALPLPDILRLVGSGALSGVASISLMTAYHRSPASLVAPFQYTQIIWGAVAGYWLWGQTPGLGLMLGAVVVALSGLYVIYSEMRVKESRL